jgi:hypothetical protein
MPEIKGVNARRVEVIDALLSGSKLKIILEVA